MDTYSFGNLGQEVLINDKMDFEEEFINSSTDKLWSLADDSPPAVILEEDRVIAQEECYQHTLEVAGAKVLEESVAEDKLLSEICLNQHRKQEEIHNIHSTAKVHDPQDLPRSKVYTDSDSYIPTYEQEQAVDSLRAVMTRNNWRDHIQPIGSGATAQCFKFDCKRSNTQVVAKMFLTNTSTSKSSADIEQQLLEEARMLQQSKGHCNILRFLGADKIEGVYVILTRFESGGTVENEVELMRQESLRIEKTALSPGALERGLKQLNSKRTEMALRLAPQLFGGLAHIHELLIVHLDIKTENLLLDWLKQRLIIADFGSAKEADSNGLLQIGNKTIGTPGFFAPEMVHHEVDCGFPCDIYSAGVCLAIMVTGQHPYSRGTPWPYREEFNAIANIYMAGRAQDTPPPAQAPEPLRDIIRRCLLRDPQGRISAAEAFSQLS